MPVKKDAEEYNMNHKRRGKAVIFNHDKFQYMSSRPGSTADVTALTETYKKLGFEVKKHQDLKRAAIQSVITECKFKQGVLN